MTSLLDHLRTLSAQYDAAMDDFKSACRAADAARAEAAYGEATRIAHAFPAVVEELLLSLPEVTHERIAS